ncbi:DUF2267 domain-containing protein [Streptomyces fractus]|uniref:DUF2267 domain-containing protein n=1 Tax=Streptomyces fractus TaxID=641806 RepID=UPI003CE8ADD4
MHPAAPSTAALWPDTSYEQLLERVRYEGVYATREQAEKITTDVLAALGRRLAADERVDLAARLPFEAARTLTCQIPDPTPLAGWAFVQDLATRTRTGTAATRWAAGTVLRAVAALAGPELLDRILTHLPPGYALLFGRAELTQTRAGNRLAGAGN